jgi:hypothetical protein
VKTTKVTFFFSFPAKIKSNDFHSVFGCFTEGASPTNPTVIPVKMKRSF